MKLANLSWQREGQHFNLSCQVSGGAPRTNLSAVLFRGEEELFRQSVGMEEPANVTFWMLASRKDHGANFSCRTELNLQPQGLELFWNSSAPLKLQTYGETMGSQQRGWDGGGSCLGCRVPRKERNWP